MREKEYCVSSDSLIYFSHLCAALVIVHSSFLYCKYTGYVLT
jgi:hypothetical protein